VTTGRAVTLEQQDPPEHAVGQVPGEVGVWVFIFGDLVVFTYMFGVFLNYRSNEGEVFAASSQFLNQDLGALYTLVLLLSSLFVVRALHWMRSGRGDRASAFFLAALGCGAVFLALKAFEWHHEIGAGRTLNYDHFMTFYFLLTGLHALHLTMGMVLLAILAVVARRGDPGKSQWILLEGGACFWHMVDFLWMIIFPLLYLVP